MMLLYRADVEFWKRSNCMHVLSIWESTSKAVELIIIIIIIIIRNEYYSAVSQHKNFEST